MVGVVGHIEGWQGGGGCICLYILQHPVVCGMVGMEGCGIGGSQGRRPTLQTGVMRSLGVFITRTIKCRAHAYTDASMVFETKTGNTCDT